MYISRLGADEQFLKVSANGGRAAHDDDGRIDDIDPTQWVRVRRREHRFRHIVADEGVRVE